MIYTRYKKTRLYTYFNSDTGKTWVDRHRQANITTKHGFKQNSNQCVGTFIQVKQVDADNQIQKISMMLSEIIEIKKNNNNNNDNNDNNDNNKHNPLIRKHVRKQLIAVTYTVNLN
jgi:hypothetical protein